MIDLAPLEPALHARVLGLGSCAGCKVKLLYRDLYTDPSDRRSWSKDATRRRYARAVCVTCWPKAAEIEQAKRRRLIEHRRLNGYPTQGTFDVSTNQ